MDLSQVNSYLTANDLKMNAVEIENLMELYAPTEDGPVDMHLFLSTLMTDFSGQDPVEYTLTLPDSPYEAHLALSGTSHLEFGVQYKPYPKHWGLPPNSQMKGHDGIMRDLPGGYGKGNAPMAKWVANNLAHDKKSETTERGTKPFPYGNYSL